MTHTLILNPLLGKRSVRPREFLQRYHGLVRLPPWYDQLYDVERDEFNLDSLPQLFDFRQAAYCSVVYMDKYIYIYIDTYIIAYVLKMAFKSHLLDQVASVSFVLV